MLSKIEQQFKEDALRKNQPRAETVDWTYLQEAFRAEGFGSLGWLDWPLEVEPEEDRRHRERAFLSKSRRSMAPGLAWMESHRDLKYRPDRVLEGARGVLVTGIGYYREDEIDSNSTGQSGFGRVARYARGRDYHKELGGRLRRISRKLVNLLPEHSFRAFVDTGPLDEVWLAEASGLGFKGRNGLAIIQGLGSWVLLGHIVTTYAFGSVSGSTEGLAGCPPGCKRCINACPNGALSVSGPLNATRCIAYMTIEHRGRLEYGEAMGDRIFGCDACQEACPFNSGIAETKAEGFRRDIAGASLGLAEVAGIGNYRQMVEKFAGSVLMRAGVANLKRNARAVAANFERRGAMDLQDAGQRDYYPEADSNG